MKEVTRHDERPCWVGTQVTMTSRSPYTCKTNAIQSEQHWKYSRSNSPNTLYRRHRSTCQRIHSTVECDEIKAGYVQNKEHFDGMYALATT